MWPRTVRDGPPKDVPIESKVKSKVYRPAKVQNGHTAVQVFLFGPFGAVVQFESI